MAKKKSTKARDLQADLQSQAALHKPVRDEGRDMMVEEGGTLLIGGAADNPTEGDTMQDVTQDVTQDDANGAAPNPFAVIVTAPDADGVNPDAVVALAAALDGQPVGSKAELATLPDNATYGAASSQAYKYRVALRDSHGIPTRAKVYRIGDTKGKDQPHRWRLQVLPSDAPTDDTAPDTDTDTDQAPDTA